MGHLKITAAKQEERIFFPLWKLPKKQIFIWKQKCPHEHNQMSLVRTVIATEVSNLTNDLHLHAAQFHFHGDRVSFHWS